MSYQEIQIEMATMFVEFDLPIPMHLYTSLLSQGIDVGALVQLYQHQELIMASSNVLVTPKGSAEWAKLFQPDTKFNAHGEYKINLRVKEDDAEDLTNELIRQVDAVYNSELKKNPKLQGKMVKRFPFEPVLNDNGEETGLVEFKLKCKARVEMKNGDSFTQRPVVYDSKGKPITEEISVGNGSVCKVAFETVPYLLASTKQASVSLRLKSVQVIDLKVFNNEQNPFDTEEGYQFEEDQSPFAEKEDTASKGDFSEDEDEDF